MSGYLGGIGTGTFLRAYYELDDVNDKSGNGNNLTNLNTVNFTTPGFGIGPGHADYGSSGTNRCLSSIANIFTALQVASFTISFWYRLNNTSSSNANARVFEICTANGGTGMRTLLSYNITAGNITLDAITTLSTTNATASHTLSSGTESHHIAIVKDSTTGLLFYFDGYLVSSGTGTGTDVGTTFTRAFAIGNTRGTLNLAIWMDVTQFIVEERVWSATEVKRYYTQGRGMFCI